jgi:Carboxypeptidase regulatory-like domain
MSAKEVPHCTFSGTAVNAITNEAVPRAMVVISGSESRSALTDGEGRFSFEDVQKGFVNISSFKPGFVNSAQRGRITAFEACTGAADNVKVLLTPMAIVTGRIIDNNAEPVEELPVKIGKWSFNGGRRVFSVVRTAVTDEDGKFRLPELDAGSYLVVAGPSSRRLEAFNHMVPVVYFPGVPERKEAAAIEVKAGATVDASMTVREVAAFKVSGRLSGAGEGQNYMLQLTNESGDEIQTTAAAEHNQFEFKFVGVPAGNYHLHSTAFGRNQGKGMLSGSASVTVAHDVVNLQVPLSSRLTLDVVVHSEVTEDSSSGYMGVSLGRQAGFVQTIRLAPVGEGEEVYASTEGDPKNPKLAINVERGTYIAQVLTNGMVYVQSARLGSVDLLREPVLIDSDQQPIEVTVRNDGARLSGTASAAATIVAIPTGGILTPPSAHAFSNGTGAAQFQMELPPGDYSLYAFDDFDAVEYSNPKVMEKYESKGMRVSLAAKEKKEVTLKVIEVTQ